MRSHFWFLLCLELSVAKSPRVHVRNGTYQGVHNSAFDQDYFLGIPYAQPPIGSLRYRNPHPLNTSWTGVHRATEYSPACVGYLGSPPEQSEDCLTINILRPSSIRKHVKLPVLVWIHGGGYFTGSSNLPAFNLTNIVDVSQKFDSPIIAVSFNYRLSGLGFLASQEIVDLGIANLGMKDQRLALHWIQENIGAFGGDKDRVTIWGESAGGFSVGLHMLGWNADTEGLFRASICQSGAVFLDGTYRTLDYFRPYYEILLSNTGCTNATDVIDCLRETPFQALNETFFTQAEVWAMPIIDGVVMHDLPSKRIAANAFAKVPLMAGTTSDEASPFVLNLGIETEDDFKQFISTPDRVGVNLTNATIDKLASVYPHDPPNQLPASYTLPSSAPPPLYAHYKRVVTYHSDRTQIGPRRWTCQIWTQHDLPTYCYRFDTKPLLTAQYLGVAHADDIPWVFSNTGGRGHAVNPFGGGAPERYFELAEEMTRRWIAFVRKGEPRVEGLTEWPMYGDERLALVFEGNVTESWVEKDVFREEGINALWDAIDELLM